MGIIQVCLQSHDYMQKMRQIAMISVTIIQAMSSFLQNDFYQEIVVDVKTDLPTYKHFTSFHIVSEGSNIWTIALFACF